MGGDAEDRLRHALAARFGASVDVDPRLAANETLARLSERASCRRFQPRPLEPALVRQLCAVALASPSKSDLQQRDLVVVEDAVRRRALTDLVSSQAWLRDAPALVMVCGNNRRQRQVHAWRGHAFANDHLDAFFNAAVDAAIALATFVVSAEASGLGCCPVSAVRDHAGEVSALLALPDHVFPVAGLALGWPAEPAAISPRLPLDVTVHTDRFDETGVREKVEAYDRRRAAVQPYARQRRPDVFGEAADYGWSEDKARQYAEPQRADFGAFVRAKGFDLS